MTLFGYDKFDNLPAEIEQRDAREIVDPSFLGRFLTDGKPNIAHFADFFRYTMFYKTDLCWADTDLFQLRRFDVDPDKDYLVYEDKIHVCNALLRIRSDSPALLEILRGCERIMDKDLPWAATQGQIDIAFKRRRNSPETVVKTHSEHLPVPFEHFHKLILPEYLDECVALCADASTVHLYNNILDRIGVYKRLLPPAGSYLHGLFTQHGERMGFEGAYPANVMRKLVESWRVRFSGELIGFRSVVRQFFPSMRRTYRRYRR